MKIVGQPFSCPVCGEVVPEHAKACPECGACEKSGWRDDGTGDGLGLPDDDFDYEKFVGEEFGSGGKRPTGAQWLWWIAAVILLIAFALSFLR